MLYEVITESMNEFFLHFLWKHRLFNSEAMVTTRGVPVEVISPGFLNSDAGPDFFNARVKIGDTIWAGNVEIHWRSSDWIKHKHQQDSAYDNVILHIVNEDDAVVLNSKGDRITSYNVCYTKLLRQAHQNAVSFAPLAVVDAAVSQHRHNG